MGERNKRTRRGERSPRRNRCHDDPRRSICRSPPLSSSYYVLSFVLRANKRERERERERENKCARARVEMSDRTTRILDGSRVHRGSSGTRYKRAISIPSEANEMLRRNFDVVGIVDKGCTDASKLSFQLSSRGSTWRSR